MQTHLNKYMQKNTDHFSFLASIILSFKIVNSFRTVQQTSPIDLFSPSQKTCTAQACQHAEIQSSSHKTMESNLLDRWFVRLHSHLLSETCQWPLFGAIAVPWRLLVGGKWNTFHIVWHPKFRSRPEGKFVAPAVQITVQRCSTLRPWNMAYCVSRH